MKVVLQISNKFIVEDSSSSVPVHQNYFLLIAHSCFDGVNLAFRFRQFLIIDDEISLVLHACKFEYLSFELVGKTIVFVGSSFSLCAATKHTENDYF